MKSAVILALTSSTFAMPFGNAIDAMFGTHNNEARQIPHPSEMPSRHPIGTGSGLPFPLPTDFPTPSGGAFPSGAFPTASGTGHNHHHHGHGGGSRTKSLAIDYQLAPTSIPKIGKVEVGKRQDSALPSFTLLDPSDAVPTATSAEGSSAVVLPTEEPSESSFPTATGGQPFPTGDLPFPTGLPTGDLPFPSGGFPSHTGGFPMPTGGFPFPTGGFPGSLPGGTGIPSIPTTLQTFTRGPRPTAEPSGLPGSDENGETDAQGWLDWLEILFGGSKSETKN
ncbi:hypothetical protein N0V83_010069 [Neocucurbitaria cava]|uniref:Uncharacterized protein n=1 Tax=Neocucurbitaria cava TaxID=798079 RepID=A0A9W9CHR4_9PLEO|nr:hypothetical protein N0V83_010069 [Neocucurbitaria cava]